MKEGREQGLELAAERLRAAGVDEETIGIALGAREPANVERDLQEE